MITWGISANSHDAALAVFTDDGLEFASHSERFSGIKNDPDLNKGLIDYARKWGEPNEIIWYERPFRKSLRQIRAGQGLRLAENNINRYLRSYGISAPVKYTDHHLAHAAAGYYTSNFNEATVVCIDSIGEFESLTIWDATKEKGLKRIYSQAYPHSIGLWYSAMTQRVGLKPQEDEYILMGMAGWGTQDHKLKNAIRKDFFNDSNKPIDLKNNLHRGCLDWNPEYYPDDASDGWKFNIAANVQWICEEEIVKVFELAKRLVPETDNCVYMGGVALNCVANSLVAKHIYPKIWIMPNPGDAGSSLGSAAYVYGDKINFEQCFIGHNIKGRYPVKKVLGELLKGNIVGVANGKAEYGPRALGNRSLLADPRGKDIKDKVNKIKHRQEFRPFAPSVLEEHAHEIFNMPVRKSQFMQFVADCKYPDKYPAICHVDGTSRVQTVSKEDNPNYYRLIKEFYKETGCPMVLNTSLNIKGQPIVNDEQDAQDFQNRYEVKVFTK